MYESLILCCVLGPLYYRQPQDPLPVPLLTLIREDKLVANWPPERDELSVRPQKNYEMQSLVTGYNALFIGEACSVPPYRSAWVEGSSEAEIRVFMSGHGTPTGEGLTDHLGPLLSATFWLEDHATEDQSGTLGLLLAGYILPWCGAVLGKVEARMHTPLWRTMAPLTRDAIAVMWDELQEEDKQ